MVAMAQGKIEFSEDTAQVYMGMWREKSNTESARYLTEAPQLISRVRVTKKKVKKPRQVGEPKKNVIILEGDCRNILPRLPDESVQCCISSPPYFSQRDYGTGQWKGGSARCDHIKNPHATKVFGNPEFVGNRPSREATKTNGYYFKDICGKCGARRIDSQLGLEATVEEYVDNSVAVFREVKRLLRNDGTLWIVLGDTYKNKELVGVPWKVTFALKGDGWKLRQEIIWSKLNPMPFSGNDRITRSHEQIFMFSKEARYYYDADAIKETGGQEFRNRRSVSTTSTNFVYPGHPAAFPEDLITPCILAGSRVGDTTLDPFSGSGTVAAVSQKLGRNSIAIELVPEYVTLMEDRCNTVRAPQTVPTELAA